MNRTEPTSPETVNSMMGEQELSVEEVTEMQMADAASAEATTEENVGIAQAPGPIPIPIPRPPFPLPKRRVSGRYRSGGSGFQLELRVDVDGTKPLKRVSGDFYSVTGATTTYFGSLIVNAPTVSVTATQVIIEGMGTYTFAASFPKIRVTIPRVSILSPPAAATVQFFNAANAPGAGYTCAFVSQYFRTVQIEQDFALGTTLFNSYNTGALPSGGPARDLSVVKAFAEAGLELQIAGITNTVIGGAGPDAKWDDNELHNAMEVQFSLWKNDPQWKVWLFLATSHVGGYRGIMFDLKGKHRQGCAVFHDAVKGADAVNQRGQLRTYVHELGHCFNLLHSWQKSFAVPPAPNRPASLSYMNYPQNYPGGTPAYWAAFPFQFDDLELVHLRHAFRNNIVMGGNNFTVGAGDCDLRSFDDPVADTSGLKLDIHSRRRFAYSEPVVVEIKLSATDTRGREVSPHLHPNDGRVKIGIRKPNGQVTLYEPLIEHCAEDEIITLDAASPSITASAYIGYGRDGFYFDQAGIYQIRAIYHAVDGSLIYSNPISLRVGHPVTANDEAIAEAYLTEETGTLFYLLGSDSEFLRRGNEALDEVIEKYGKHQLAVYAELVKGMNLSREFKSLTPEKNVVTRKPEYQAAARYLSSVADSEASRLIDPTTMDMALNQLAATQEAMGDEKAAKSTLKRVAPKAARAARAGAGTR